MLAALPACELRQTHPGGKLTMAYRSDDDVAEDNNAVAVGARLERRVGEGGLAVGRGRGHMSQSELGLPPYEGRPRMGEVEAWAHGAGLWPLIGTDEVGRGPLAGPVVAAAVALPQDAALLGTGLEGLADSKELTEAQREELVPRIEALALAWHVEPAWQQEIAEKNILHASLAAMQRACAAVVAQLRERGHPAAALLVLDGNQTLRGWERGRQVAVVKGDRRSRAVAAAAVLAKVWRDRHMVQLEQQYPGYGLAKHKGYPTAEHLAALARLGPSPVHRREFGPVKALGRQGSLWVDG